MGNNYGQTGQDDRQWKVIPLDNWKEIQSVLHDMRDAIGSPNYDDKEVYECMDRGATLYEKLFPRDPLAFEKFCKKSIGRLV